MHLEKLSYAPEAFLAFLVCPHIQNFALFAYSALLMHCDIQKCSRSASFDFEYFQVEGNRSGSQKKHLEKQFHALEAYLAFLVCHHIQNYDLFAYSALLVHCVTTDMHNHCVQMS